ncbi:MAG: ribonuclease HI family protein [Pleurocapsa sp. MO_226.B13]|nr:ribonuclease HI family protein [Pleurocapsa sp. MO_226.B13]
MARPKKIIARTKVQGDRYQICLFRRQGKNQWHINKILIDDAPLSLDEAKEKMKEFSEQLNIPWLQKPLQDVTRKRLHNSAKRKARKEKLRKARALKPPLLTFDGSSLERPGRSASASVIEMPDFTRHTVTRFIPSAFANEAEYTGLIIGLEKAKELGISKLDIKGDSQTVIYQVSGKYQLNNDSKFLVMRDRVLNLLSFFDDYSLTWIPRRRNQLADRAARKCLKENSPEEVTSPSYAEQYIDDLIYGNSDWFDDDYYYF